MFLPEAEMLAVVTERGDVGVMRAMALAIAAAIAAAALSLCDCNREDVPEPPWPETPEIKIQCF